MTRSVATLFTLLWLGLLSGCGLLGEAPDKTAGWSAQRLYAEAKAELSDGNYENAIKLYEKLESRYPYGRYAQQAQMEIAYAYFRQNEIENALAACDRFIKLHPNHPNVDYMYYLKGVANFNEDLGLLAAVSRQDPTERDPKAAKDSFNAFRDLVTRYPDSKYTPDAMKRLAYLVNALAALEVHVARYYYKRGAYVAAANRATVVVTTYQTSPALEEALGLQVLAYDKLGLAQLRDDAMRVMKLNFPDSRYAQGIVEPKQPWWKLW
ncbi:MAG: outer membrane protein assembly factor BamD [Rhodocyclaceae bacterium]|nr:outer membrane protein assembly factor BamD [Rhodocyclaceae bacterium]MBX3666890.1 outer membrane protein assembly factor BamD [Rhodocyclaceae bacterium]